MKLTIGMAVYDDFDGVYFTIQAMRMYHHEVMKDVEFLVIDNKPDSQASPHIKSYVESQVVGVAAARYIPMAEATGTTQPRNRVFQEAQGEYVMCVDSHILVWPQAIRRLIEWYETHPESMDLLSGPMLYDNLRAMNTHFDDFWRAEMWGIWGLAWTCNCFLSSPKEEPPAFTILQDKQGNCDYRRLGMGLTLQTSCPHCGRAYPFLAWPQHEPKLINAGFTPLGMRNDGPAFAIPGMGLGLFSCRREAWLGFNPHFRGFGGEEMYIHEKYRQAGHKALCLPFLKWGHRFSRPGGIPYKHVLTRYNKIRNYVLGALEVGYSTDRIYEHFVLGKLCPQWEWDYIVSDPVSRTNPPTINDAPTEIRERLRQKPPAPGLPQPRATISEHSELMAWAKSNPRDLDKHLDKIAEYAAKCDHVTEVTHRRESTVALLAARKKVCSYQSEHDPLIGRLIDIFPTKLDAKLVKIDSPPQLVEETELLFLDTVGTYDRLKVELFLYTPKVSRYIIIHDTQVYAEKGEYGGSRGLLPALREFMREQPEWSVIYHTTEQYGLTVIGKDKSEKEKLPSLGTMAANFAKAMANFASDGLKQVTKEQYEERLNICSVCTHRVGNRCAVCGCGLAAKATGRAMECPIGKWPSIPVSYAVENMAESTS